MSFDGSIVIINAGNGKTGWLRTPNGGSCALTCHGTNHYNGGAGQSYP